jgi:hypothetical protein
MKQLAQQNPLFRRGHALIAQLVVAGEFPLGWVYSFRVETMKHLRRFSARRRPSVHGQRPLDGVTLQHSSADRGFQQPLLLK